MKSSRIFYRIICIIFSLILNFLSLSEIECKVFKKCELANELYGNNVPYEKISDWLCIAQNGANYNTTAMNLKYAKFGGNAYYGIFQISDQYGCLPSSSICGLSSCNNLMDDYITDDIKCLLTIYNAYKSAVGDGFSGWPVYNKKCKNIQSKITFDECFENEIVTRRKTFKTAVKKTAQFGKVYERCELARELRDVHGIPESQVATWVCIAKHESSYNTSAVGHLNWDGSGDHGLFQISDIYWCSPPGKGWTCGLSCDKLEDGDITDDVECMQRIFSEHQRLSGDGFSAWAVYQPYCQGRSDSYIKGCFDEHSVTQRPRPGIVAPTVPKYRPKTIGKVYERCELAQELYYKFSLPMDQIATWVCIAHRESNYNTSAVGHLNWDGSGDHGLFQISDIYWCSLQGRGKACGLSCSELEDDDITDDINCIKMIHDEHTRLSGNGFNAWAVYKPYCQGQTSHHIDGCNLPLESGQRPIVPRPGVTSPTKRVQPKTGPKTKGKVYKKCELARELYYDHNIKMDQVGTWVCIAKYESNYNTSAIGRLNADGSEDHGLFQISDIYWCSPPGKGWACGLSCDKLEDDDISDDLECMKKIHEEHTRLSGDGFNAWTVYNPHCKGKGHQFIEGCFDEIPVKKHQTTTKKPKRPQTFPKSKGKVYERCELAEELLYKYKLPINEIATWVCIAHRESGYNTSAIGRLNWDGSEDHGLFQISDIYWCSPPGKGWACGVTCAELEDSDISDDVECIKIIHGEHTRLSGDGFNAWTVYKSYCKGNVDRYLEGCFQTKSQTTRKTSSRTTKKYVTINRKTTKAPPIFYTTQKLMTTQKVPPKINSISTTKSWASWFIPTKSSLKTSTFTQKTVTSQPETSRITKTWSKPTEKPTKMKSSTTIQKLRTSTTKSSLKTNVTQKPWYAWTKSPTKPETKKPSISLTTKTTPKPWTTPITESIVKAQTMKSTEKPKTSTKSSTTTRKSSVSSQKQATVTLAPPTVKKTTSIFDFYLESFGKPKSIPTFKPFIFKETKTTAKTSNDKAFNAYVDKYFQQ